MELRQLISFVEAATSGSMTAAAMKCNITQAAVSQHIKSLEEEFGVTFFVRRRKELTLTDEGAVFLESAKTIIQNAEDARERLSVMKGELCGDLRIGIGSFIEPFVGLAIAEFMNKFPKVRLHVHYDYAHVLNRLLRSHEIDAAFSMNQPYDTEGIVSEPCFRFRLCAVMHKSHRLARKEYVTFEELTKCRIIIPDTGKRELATMQRYTDEDISRLLSVSCCECNNANAILNGLEFLDAVTFMPQEYVILRTELVAIPIQGLDTILCSNVHRMGDVPMKASLSEFIKILRNDNI